MARELTVELLQEIIDAFNSRDVDRIASHFAEDATFYASRGGEVDGNTIKGRDAIAKYVADRFGNIPDMSWEPVDDYIVDDRRAVSVWIVRGHEKGGQVIESRGVDLWEFRGDKILFKDTYWKIKQ